MIVIVLLTLVSASCAQRMVEPPLRISMEPPEEAMMRPQRNVFQTWIPMPIDHFDPQNSDTYLMRYMFNEEFFGGDGSPIFIFVGGEWTISAGWLLAGNMYEMARENNGYIIYTEHRYYGQSLPYQNFTTENLRFLNVDQALADLAYFIQAIKSQQSRFADSEVILYGGSYAANMALWFKQRYPHLAKGVIASSGPIMGKVDFTEYLEVVHEAFLLEGGEQCIATIRQGILDTLAAMETETGRRTLEQNYRLCGPLNYDNQFELGYFSGLISWTFSTSVQQAVPGTLINVCNNFATETYGTTPMQKIGGYIAAIRNLGAGCWNLDYDSYVNAYTVPVSNSKAWYYQTCTEYGYYQTAPRIGTVFDPLRWLSVEFYVDLCKRAFDQRFDEAFVYDAVDRVNLIFGGLSPNVNNTVNIHGASHCFDMQPWRATDTPRITAAQLAARRTVSGWLQETD